jgi:predicted TIM-barrel fold metal-dependent hydrolase
MGRAFTLLGGIVGLSLLLLPTILVGQVSAEIPQNLYQGQFIDAHHHFIVPGVWSSVSEALAQMDQAGIAKIVAFADMRVSFSVFKQYPDRLIPSYGVTEGGPPLNPQTPDDPRWVGILRQALDGGYVGIGEMSWRSSSHKPPHDMSADNPVAKQIADLAAEKGVPINLHHEIGTKAHGPEMIPEFERLLDYDKNATYVWAHTGYARPAPVAKLLASHSNLYADLSTRTPGHAFSAYSGYIADLQGTISPEWKELFEKFPDRFMFGTDKGADVAFASDKSFERAGVTVTTQNYLIAEAAFFRIVLGQLSPDLAERIAYGNIQKVMKQGQPTNLSINVDHPSTSVGSQVKISGKLLPAMKDLTVALTYSFGGEQGKRILKTGDDGSFTETINVEKAGTWTFAATTSGAIGWIGSESNSVTVLVRAR